MIAVLEPGCPMHQKAEVVRLIENEGLRAQVSELEHETLVGVVGQAGESLAARLEALPGVREVRMTAPPYPLTARAYHPADSRIRVAGVTLRRPRDRGGRRPVRGRGREQLLATARRVAAAGARLLRGGAFKPRSLALQLPGPGRGGAPAARRRARGHRPGGGHRGPGPRGRGAGGALRRRAADRRPQHAELPRCSRRSGPSRRPVLLKRGMMATLDELLLAAEYVAAAGNPHVILCERGIRTFEPATRNTLDLVGRARAQGADAPAGDRGSEPRRRPRASGSPPSPGPRSPRARTA